MKLPSQTAGALLAGLLALAPASKAAPLKFDFGSEKSAVFPGFTPVSDKTRFAADAPFGLVSGAPQAFDRLRPDPLQGDFLWSQAPFTFRVNLPDGAYKAWFLYGDSRYKTRIITPLAKKNRVLINGKEAVSAPLSGWKEFYSEKYFFRGYSDVYHANDDFYAKYIAPDFKQASAAFEVTGGQATFTFEDIPLCAMIVYPAAEAAQDEDDISYLLKKELRRHTVIHEVKPDNLPPEPEYSAADKQRGYALYSRFASNPPLATDRPLAEELNPAPSAFLAAGQTADLSLTVLPLKDLQNVKVTVSDLSDKAAGAKIPASAVQVQYIAQHAVNKTSPRETTAAYTYQVLPRFITPFPAAFELMDKGVNCTILLSIAAAGSTRPGVYEGSVTIAPQNAPLRAVPLRVRVLPITLPPQPLAAGRFALDYDFYYYYYWSKTFTDDSFRDFVWDRQKMRMQWAKDMGLTTISWSDDSRGDILADPPRLDPNGRFVRWMDLYRDMGFTKPMPWYGFQAITGNDNTKLFNLRGPRLSPEWIADYRQLMANVRDTGKARKWPEVLFYLSDELSNDGPPGTAEGLKRAEASSDVPGTRRIASVNGKFELPLIGKVEILMPNFAFPITQPVLDEMKAKGTELWIYNVTDQRFSWGYYPYRVQAKGRIQWFNNSGVGYPFDDFDSDFGSSIYDAFVAGPNGPVSMVNALDMRDGLDDLRYLTLLQQLVERAKNPQDKAAVQGKALLKEINDTVAVDLRGAEGTFNARDTGFGGGAKIWSPEKCERMRWRVAEAILALQKSDAGK